MGRGHHLRVFFSNTTQTFLENVTWLESSSNHYLVFISSEEQFQYTHTRLKVLPKIDPSHIESFFVWLAWEYPFHQLEVIYDEKELEVDQVKAIFYTQQYDIKESINAKSAYNLNIYDNLIHNRAIYLLSEEQEVGHAIICGAGHSLLKYIERVPKNAFLFASGNSFPFLLQKGYCPDCVVAIDPQAFKEKTFTYYPPLIFQAHIHPQTLKDWKGQVILSFAQEETPLTQALFPYELREKYKVISGSSSVLLALGLAIKMKCKSIYFLGVDLKYQNGKRYPNSLPSGEENEDFQIFAREIEKVVEAHPKIKFFRIGDEGFPLKGVTSIQSPQCIFPKNKRSLHIGSSLKYPSLIPWKNSLKECIILCEQAIQSPHQSLMELEYLEIEETLVFKTLLVSLNRISKGNSLKNRLIAFKFFLEYHFNYLEKRGV